MRIFTQNSIVNCISGIVRSNVEGTCDDNRMDLGSDLRSRLMQRLSLGTTRMASFDGSSRFARFVEYLLGQPTQVSAIRLQQQSHVISRLAWQALDLVGLPGVMLPAPVVETKRATERGTYSSPMTRTA